MQKLEGQSKDVWKEGVQVSESLTFPRETQISMWELDPETGEMGHEKINQLVILKMYPGLQIELLKNAAITYSGPESRIEKVFFCGKDNDAFFYRLETESGAIFLVKITPKTLKTKSITDKIRRLVERMANWE